MAAPRFYLKDNKSDNPTLIYLRYRITEPPVKWSTGEKVKPTQWNYNKNRVKKVEGIDSKAINRRLEAISTEAKTIAMNLESQDENVTPKKIKDRLNKKFRTGRNQLEYNKDLKGYFNYYIIVLKNRGAPSHRSFTTTLKLLEEYMEKFGYHSFNDIDMDFYNKFLDFLNKREYSVNYMGRIIRNLKSVLSHSYDDRIHSNDIFRSRRFAAMSEDVYNIYLNMDELKALYNKDFSFFKQMDLTRDRFLLGCFIGSRFANWVNMGEAQLTEDAIIYETVKVKERIEFPLHWIAKKIIHKYGGTFPPSISNQKMNKNLKHMGKLAKFNDEVIRTRTVAGKRKVERYKKYELLTTHTARRSLATNMYKASVPVKLIMYATGHSTINQFMNYVKSSMAEEMADELKEHSFFNK